LGDEDPQAEELRTTEFAASTEDGGSDGAATAAAEETWAEPPAPATQAVRRKPATSTLVAAGVVGGIVALALAGSMQYAGYLPNGAGTSTPPSEELVALQQQVEELAQSRGPDPDLQARVQALETAANEGTGSDAAAQVASL